MAAFNGENGLSNELGKNGGVCSGGGERRDFYSLIETALVFFFSLLGRQVGCRRKGGRGPGVIYI